ncbi:MAG: hypothetical protein EAZ88_13225 [Oscillatoriales cyanobacterium]|nr:MAG: hypothetical protein EAZ88_13225 [Oscillatoriales cyanobacterium]
MNRLLNIVVSIPLRGSRLGKSSATNPYPQSVPDAKSTHRFFTLNKWGVIFNKHRIENAQPQTTKTIDAPQRKNQGFTDRPRCVEITCGNETHRSRSPT